ncbi:response regulator [Spirosoma taeanense]|uniref:histidine kinase n=1 Tax=Spirosoma taeanense TaxID=2735870 RepID=A0A6M5Y511_9BACT|nr:response regulator [Spirosoma taeanense]QJW88486.1 response regulator [Spirosoma taeanense]
MKTKILLVDDEPDLEALFQQHFRRRIQANQYEFIYAHDGMQALAIIREQPDIDVVLSDINMPGMDGLTLLAKLLEVNPVARTVMVTAYDDMSNIRTAMNRGAFDFVCKPIDFGDLAITIEKTAEYVRQLRESMELRAIDEMKMRFFANITHEFRTPLSLIVAPVDKLLTANDLPTPYLHSLSIVRQNAQHMLQLINQLLDIAKLEAGAMTIVNKPGDLGGFVSQIVEVFRPSAEIKNIDLTYRADLLSSNYLFDADKWEKILYNLLSNAVKFTETGCVAINLTEIPDSLPAVGSAQSEALIRLTVRDTGIGIAADKRERIFNRFYQVDSARTRAYEGTGIGLALVKELTERLGGTITVESPPAGEIDTSGTCFNLILPVQVLVAPVDRSLVAPKRIILTPVPDSVVVPSPPQSDETPLILVVEDNHQLREFIIAELTPTYRVRSAANGEEGWDLVQQELPDVVISDVMMQEMDGYDLTKQIKSHPETDHIAVILLTAKSEHDDVIAGLRYGADDYIIKPFNLDEVHLRLSNLINRQQKLRDQYSRQLTQPDDSSLLDTVQNPFLRQVYTLIERHLDQSALTVEWMAEELSISRKTLYRKVHTLTHLAPNELIRQYRLRKAAQLLRAGHNASETAYMVGFETPSHFTSVFKEFYKKTPSEFALK